MSDSPEISAFLRRETLSHLVYLLYLRHRGIEVDQSRIDSARSDVRNASPGMEVLELELEELQGILATVDAFESSEPSNIKARLHQLGPIKLRMRPEHNHQTAHFHLEYKQEHNASYSVDPLKKLAGFVPRKYEQPMLEWAERNQKLLLLTWEKLNAGEDIRELEIRRDV